MCFRSDRIRVRGAGVKRVSLSVQNGWLIRCGFRGRFLTVHHHSYSGKEATERFHTHTWWVAFGIVLKGRIVEEFGDRESGRVRKRVVRSRGSIRVYTRKTAHRIVEADAETVFFGLFRAQKPALPSSTVRTPEGYSHYTEIMPDEAGFRPDFVSVIR